MIPYSPATNKGRAVAMDDILHRPAKQSHLITKAAAKLLRHAARQQGRQQARGIDTN